MPTTWEDVDRAVQRSREVWRSDGPPWNSPTDAVVECTRALTDAVSALAELLAPPEGMDERIAEAVAAEAGWEVMRLRKTAGGTSLLIDNYRGGEWEGTWLTITPDDGGTRMFSQHYPTEADAKAAAAAWLAEHDQVQP